MSRRARSQMVRVAMLNAEGKWGDAEASMKVLEEQAAPLVGKGIDVLITPECFTDGYMTRDKKRCTTRKLRACALTGPKDPIVRRAGRLAKRLGSYLVLGATEKDDSGTMYNTAYLLDREGKHVGTYHKLHPCEFYTPGDRIPVFETDFGKVGIVICADRRFPEDIRCMRLQGAKIICNPTWGFYGDLNTAIIRVRAYENGIPVCFTHPDQALICLGNGQIAALVESTEPSVYVHDLDLSWDPAKLEIIDRSWSHPTLYRRPELYGPIVETP